MREKEFEYNGYECTVRFKGDGLPGIMVDDGEEHVLPPDVILDEPAVNYLDEDDEFWIDKVKDYLDDS
jgi:hypothetical protein